MEHTTCRLHYDSKKERDYSDVNISQQQATPMNVLTPNTKEQDRQRIQEAGKT
jgi:hypothetical protein